MQMELPLWGASPDNDVTENGAEIPKKEPKKRGPKRRRTRTVARSFLRICRACEMSAGSPSRSARARIARSKLRT